MANPVDGLFVVSLADVATIVPTTGDVTEAADYMNATVEIMAEDDGGLWTTQSFRRQA